MVSRARATDRGTITVPGFRFAGVACGVKRRKRDLALIVADEPAAAAALFTTNQVKAAPVLVGQRRLRRRGSIQAVVVNSGNANACTGERGLRDAEEVCRRAGELLGIDPELVFPSSTGVIGVRLPVDRIARGLEQAVAALSPFGLKAAAEAMLTTDRFPKIARERFRIDGRAISVVGLAKGAGMIAPRLATMLAYILTDAAVERGLLRRVLRECAEETFNRVTVDGDTSTNDTVLALANGKAGNSPLRGGPRAAAFRSAVRNVMRELALKLVEDGEGATKVVELRVERASSDEAARQVAFAVANSLLVKTAFFGADPNFGRIVAAAGKAGVRFDAERVDVFIEDIPVVRRGVGTFARERQAARAMRRPTFRVRLSLNQGKGSATVWTSDLTYDYVRINSAYRT
jgi:glutamate N-acetyltransferase/amino-acid N-acetyltransferase